MARDRGRVDDGAARAGLFAERVRRAMAGKAPERELAALMEAAYLEGRSSAAPSPRPVPAVREIRVDMLRQRCRDAFETLRVLSGARLRDVMEPLVLVEETDLIGSVRVHLVSPSGWQDHSWGKATLAQLRDLGVIVPVAEGEATLTLSRRGMDLMLKDVTTTDVPASPAWEIPAADHVPGGPAHR